MNKKFIVLLVFCLIFLQAGQSIANEPQKPFENNQYHNAQFKGAINFDMKHVDQSLIKWMKKNVSQETGLPLSFEIPFESKSDVYAQMGDQYSANGIIERVIVEEGLVVYDGAVRQIVFTMLGSFENLEEAYKPIDVYWNGELGDLANIRAGYPINNFVYDTENPDAVSSDLTKKGERGFIFRIINANGRYTTQDPLDGKKEFEGFPTWPAIHWEDWKPVAGENAWIVMSALHLYHKKYFNFALNKYDHSDDSIELSLAEELARAAILLQAENGGIRMAPIGTYFSEGDQGKRWYNLISTENNLSWYAAFRMLYQVTQKEIYKNAMISMDSYFRTAWDNDKGYFHQGMRYEGGRWLLEEKHFATDVQTWSVLVLGCETIDKWLGEGSSYRAWEAVKNLSGSRDNEGRLLGVGFTTENDRISVEWTAGAIFAAKNISEYYKYDNPKWATSASVDAKDMRDGIESLRFELADGRAAYSYSSKRDWIPFGWFSHDPNVLSLASTAWVVLLDADFNPFNLPKQQSIISNFELVELGK